MSETPKPSAGWYGVAAGIFILFGIAVPVTCIFVLIGSISGGRPFLVPGKVNFTWAETGTYVLWNETSTIYEGRTYAPGEALPDGMVVTITDAVDGRVLTLTSDQSTTEQSGGESRRSVGTFEVARPGSYSIEVKGKFPDRIFYVRKSVMGRVFGAILGMIVSGAVGVLGALILAISVFIRRSRS